MFRKRARVPKKAPPPRPHDLFTAAMAGDAAAVRAYLELGEAVDGQNAKGERPLQLAVRCGQVEAAHALMEAGADVTFATASGWTLVMSAAVLGDSGLVAALLDRGAAIDPVDIAGHTALSVAALHGHNACARTLIERGADVDLSRDPLLYTPLMFAAAACDAVTVQLLLDKGADPNVRSYDRMSPLRCAEQYGRANIAAILRTAGALT